MKRGRVFWALGLVAIALAAMVGLSTAGAALPLDLREEEAPEQAAFAPMEIAEEPEQPVPPEPPLETLAVAVRGDELEDAMRLTFFDMHAEIVCKAALDQKIGGVCQLPPGADYEVQTRSGLKASFRLEENGSISNVVGAGWTDGEILYLTTSPKAVVTVLGSVAGLEEEEYLEFSLTGPGYDETRYVGWQGDSPVEKAVFAGVALGEYTLTGPGGQTRQVVVSEAQMAISISME